MRKDTRTGGSGLVMNKEDEINQLVSFLHEIEQDRELSREEKQTVMIEGAINSKEMCDHVVTCSRGDRR